MKLSIIIPVYNVEKYVGECLDSLLNQNFDPKTHEIILVNDGSTDRSLEIIESYAKKYSQIKIFSKENGGIGSARNYGLLHAGGKYIYFIDSDDFIVSNSLKLLVDTCERHDLSVLTFLSTRYPDGSEKVEESIPENINLDSVVSNNLLSSIVSGEDYLATMEYRNEVWWYVINRAFLEETRIKFQEGLYLEDAIFTLSVFLKSERMAHLKLDAHRYRIAPESVLTKREPSHYLKLIRDMQTVVMAFEPIIKSLENKGGNPQSIKRIKAKQQSLVFFSMVRILKSSMSFDEVKQRLEKMHAVGAYPLDSFLGPDYSNFSYRMLVPLFNRKWCFYFIFKLVNPMLKLKNKS